MAFRLSDLMNERSIREAEQVENVPEERMETVYRDVFDLVPSEDNFYSTEKLENMKQSIEAFGVLQNLLIRKEDGKDIVVSGHCRRLCCIALVESGKSEFRMVPCTYQRKIKLEMEELPEEAEGIINQLILIHANRFREKSDWEKMTETVEMKRLIEELRKSVDLQGNTRKIMEDMIGTKGTQQARYFVIHNNLSEKLMQAFRTEQINVSVAYEAARMDEEGQQEAYEVYCDNGILNLSDIQNITERKKAEEQTPGQMELSESDNPEEQEAELSDSDNLEEQEAKTGPLSRKRFPRCIFIGGEDCISNDCEGCRKKREYDRIRREAARQMRSQAEQSGVKLSESDNSGMPEQREAKLSESDNSGISEQNEAKLSESDNLEKPERCAHRPEYICTREDTEAMKNREGIKCAGLCCWECKDHGRCGYECNSSAFRPKTKLSESDNLEIQEQSEPKRTGRKYEPLFVRGYLRREEATLEECMSIQGLPVAVTMKQEALVIGLRALLKEAEEAQGQQEEL